MLRAARFNGNISQRALRVAAFLVFTAVVGWQAERIAQAGLYFNWDMLAYVACALNFEENDIEIVHERAYAAVKEVVPETRWKDLTRRDRFRQANFSDPEAFRQVLPFYRARLLYTGAIYLLHKAGIQIARASALVSTAAYVLTAILIFLWASKRVPPVWALPISLGFCFSPSLVAAARNSTPDALCTFVVLAALFVLVEYRKTRIGIVMLIAGIFARPDTVVFTLLLVAALGLLALPRDRCAPRWAATFFLSAVVVYFGLAELFGSRPWWVVLQFTAINTPPYIDDIQTSFDGDLYLTLLARNFGRVWGSLIFVHIALALVGAWAMIASAGGSWRRLPLPALVLLTLVLSVVARFILFPLPLERLYAPYLVSIELVLLAAVASLATTGGRGNSSTGASA